MSVASAFSGLTYRVCRPVRGCPASSIKLGRNLASVLPPPVGATSSALSPVLPGLDHIELEATRRPPAPRKPARERFR